MTETTADQLQLRHAQEPASALAVLADMHATRPVIPRPIPFGTGFHPLDDVLNGGIRTGDLMLLGGKPGQGKTIAALQWARHTAKNGGTSIVANYEHDPITLITRLLACELGEVAHSRGVDDELRLDELQRRLRDVAAGTLTLREVLDSDHLLLDAEDRLTVYAERLVLVQASGLRTDVVELGNLIDDLRDGRTLLVIDYLQKVPVHPDTGDEAERVKRVVEGVKDLALTRQVGVIAIAAADRDGLTSRRLRIHHFRGSTALAYEADAVVVLNDKLTVVSKAHLAYDTTRAEDFRRQVLFTIEKNRNGVSDVDLEFAKDFANYRFHPEGRWVVERLWTEGTLDE